MKTEGAMKGLRGSAWGLVLGVVLCGLSTQAHAQVQETVRAVQVTAGPATGEAGDTVVASLVDTGLRTGQSVRVTLRVLDASGAVVAETSGVVSEGVPLRLTYRASATAGVYAQVVVPLGPDQLAAPVLVLERWNPSFPLRAPRPPVVCVPPMGENVPETGPVLNCDVHYLDVRIR